MDNNLIFNPMNVRSSDQKFMGEVIPSKHLGFKQFESMAYGIRAGCKILITYYQKYGLNNISTIINRWAPPSDGNDTEAYKKNVADRMGIGIYEGFKVNDPNELQLLAKAICYQEQGEIAFTQDDIKSGVAMALGNLT